MREAFGQMQRRMPLMARKPMRSITKFVSVIAFVGMTALPSFAFAAPENDLASAENAYASVDYPTASTKAEEVLAQRGLNHDVLVRATRVAALSHAALGHTEKAKEYFVLLLGYDPDFKVDTKLGPRFAEPFAEARGYWQAQGRKPSMEVQAVMQYGQAGQLRVATVDPMNNIKRIAVGYRWAPAREYTNATVEPGTRNIEVPANPNGAGRLDYWVRAMDAKDSAVFEEGTPEGPKTAVVSEPATRAGGVTEEKKSFFGSGLFFAATGVILAGAAVGGYFLFRPTDYTPATTGRSAFGASCGNVRCE
jgi:hypothetical protein